MRHSCRIGVHAALAVAFLAAITQSAQAATTVIWSLVSDVNRTSLFITGQNFCTSPAPEVLIWLPPGPGPSALSVQSHSPTQIIVGYPVGAAGIYVMAVKCGPLKTDYTYYAAVLDPEGGATLGANTFTGVQTAPAFVGDGAGLTNLGAATNASQLGGIAASQYVLTGDARMNDARAPLAGSPNYIQNNPPSPQAANVNISGDATAGRVGVGAAPNFGLDVNADVVAYQDIAFRRGVHRWRLTSPATGLQIFQVYDNQFTLINQPRLTVADSGDVGIGTIAPSARLHVVSDNEGVYAHTNTGYAIHARSETNYAGFFEGYVYFSSLVFLPTLGGGGSTALCRNAFNQVSSCSSSLRYKKDVEGFSGGLDTVTRLRPISFTWKDSGARDVGFAAEEVAKVEPLLTFRNGEGEIEGVNYGQLSTVFVNAFKEQQAQIQEQREHIRLQQAQIDRQEDRSRDREAALAAQQQQIDELRQLVCHMAPAVGPCR